MESFWRSLLHLIYPQACLLCQRRWPMEASDLCADCAEWLGQWRSGFSPCRYCGRLRPGPPGTCPGCLKERPPFVVARAVGPHRGPLKEAVHALKYRGVVYLAEGLAGLMAQEFYREQHLKGCDLVVPVPLSPRHQRERGYNQAQLLAAALASQVGLRQEAVLVRQSSARSQVALSREERQLEVQGAFASGGRLLSGARVLLVDDVFTTGATAAACARALLASGAREVAVLTITTSFA